jgi:hypothetical protein
LSGALATTRRRWSLSFARRLTVSYLDRGKVKVKPLVCVLQSKVGAIEAMAATIDPENAIKLIAVLESIEGDKTDGFERLLSLLSEVAKGENKSHAAAFVSFLRGVVPLSIRLATTCGHPSDRFCDRTTLGGMEPKLRGTPRQVAWAENIRAGYFARIERRDNDLRESLAHSRSLGHRLRAALAREARLLAYIKSQSAASWWIDRRGMTLEKLAVRVAGEMRE